MSTKSIQHHATSKGYTLTVEPALLIVIKVLAGKIKLGFQTPAAAYGADWIMEIAGVSRQDSQRTRTVIENGKATVE